MALSPLYLYAGLGEIVAEKSGVVNLGIEGIMLMSAFSMLATDLLTGNAWFGVVVALGVGAAFGIAFAYMTVLSRLDQIVLGLAVYLFGLGMSFVIYNTFAPIGTILPSFVNIGKVTIPYLSTIPIIGPVLFHQDLLMYFSLLLLVLVYYFLNRTSLGLRVRAVGEDPKAADNMGVSVQKVRFLAVLFGAILAGLAGAYFVTDFLQSFQFDIIAGRGFIALAMVYFANWRPSRLLIGALLFNIVYASQSEFVAISSTAIAGSSALFNMLPYVFLIVLIPLLGRKARPPKFLLKPYRKG